MYIGIRIHIFDPVFIYPSIEFLAVSPYVACSTMYLYLYIYLIDYFYPYHFFSLTYVLMARGGGRGCSSMQEKDNAPIVSSSSSSSEAMEVKKKPACKPGPKAKSKAKAAAKKGSGKGRGKGKGRGRGRVMAAEPEGGKVPSFARRPRPLTAPSATKWDAVVSVFQEKIAPKIKAFQRATYCWEDCGCSSRLSHKGYYTCIRTYVERERKGDRLD